MDVTSPTYIVLVCFALVIALVLVLSMYMSNKVFIYLLLTYGVAVSIFMMIYLSSIKKKVDQNNKYEIAVYISLYNIFCFFGLLALYVIFNVFKNRSPSSYSSYSSYNRY